MRVANVSTVEEPMKAIGTTKSLSALELDIQNNLSILGRETISRWLKTCGPVTPYSTTYCCNCGAEARYKKKGKALLQTRFGPVAYQRAVYGCDACGKTTAPLDERLHPVQSLARMRMRLAAGINLPVSEMAAAWGLGSLSVVVLPFAVDEADNMNLSFFSALRPRSVSLCCLKASIDSLCDPFCWRDPSCWRATFP